MMSATFGLWRPAEVARAAGHEFYSKSGGTIRIW
jgi:hypothetical protein